MGKWSAMRISNLAMWPSRQYVNLAMVISLAQGELSTHVRALSMSFFPVHLQFSLLFHSPGSVFILMFMSVLLGF